MGRKIPTDKNQRPVPDEKKPRQKSLEELEKQEGASVVEQKTRGKAAKWTILLPTDIIEALKNLFRARAVSTAWRAAWDDGEAWIGLVCVYFGLQTAACHFSSPKACFLSLQRVAVWRQLLPAGCQGTHHAGSSHSGKFKASSGYIQNNHVAGGMPGVGIGGHSEGMSSGDLESQFCVTGGLEGTILLWSLQSGAMLCKLGVKSPVLGVSLRGKTIVAWTNDGKANLIKIDDESNQTKMIKTASIEPQSKLRGVEITEDPKEDHARVTLICDQSLLQVHSTTGDTLKEISIEKVKAISSHAARLSNGTAVVVMVTASHLFEVYRLSDLTCLQSVALSEAIGGLLDPDTRKALSERVGCEWRREESDGGQHWISLCSDDSKQGSTVWLGVGGLMLSGALGSPESGVDSWSLIEPPTTRPGSQSTVSTGTGGGSEADAAAKALLENPRRQGGRVRLLASDGDVTMYLSWPSGTRSEAEEEEEKESEDEDDGLEQKKRCWLHVIHCETGHAVHSIEINGAAFSSGPGVWKGVAMFHEGHALFSCCADHPAVNSGLGALVKYPRQRKPQANHSREKPQPGGEAEAAAASMSELALDDSDDDDFFGEGNRQKKEKREKKGKVPLAKDKAGRKGTRGAKSRTG